jgi:hypothetical protein
MSEKEESANKKPRYVKMAQAPVACGHDHSEDDKHCFYKGGPISHELFSHLPFSVLSVTLGLIFTGLICFLVSDSLVENAGQLLEQAHGHSHTIEADPDPHAGHDHAGHDHAGHDHAAHEEEEPASKPGSALGFLFLFHLFHPAHILFSAIATTAMFYKYDKNLLKAVIIGFVGSILICTVSDALVPTATTYLMGFGNRAPIHLCLLDSPMQVIPFAALGVLLGLAATVSGSTNSTIMSHSIHVISSTMATLFYTVAFTGRLLWINQIGTVFLMTCVAVGGICCLSDVVFPLFFTRKARAEYAKTGHHHPH